MARHSSSQFLLALTLVVLLFPLSLSPSLQAKQASLIVQVATSIPTRPKSTAVLEQETNIRIIMPKPEEGGFEWVELYNASSYYFVYLPLILRNASGSMVATRQVDSAPVPSDYFSSQLDIGGWQVTDVDGNVFTIPEGLLPVPQEPYVLIVFDGLDPGHAGLLHRVSVCGFAGMAG
jgi:hypothetical protein